MKKITFPILALLLSLSVTAQKFDRSKLKALKIAHITEQLDLTEKEAQAFWPIYNANEEAKDKMRSSFIEKRFENLEELSEAEAKVHLDEMIKMEEAKLNLDKQYQEKLLKVLSAKKILKLMEADRSFRRKMIQEFRERHKDRREKDRP